MLQNISIFIELPFVSKIFILSIFEWSLKTDFTVFHTVFSLELDSDRKASHFIQVETPGI